MKDKDRIKGYQRFVSKSFEREVYHKKKNSTYFFIKKWEAFFGFILYHFFSRKTFVFILGTMRSGSTLLKALLAEARDVSNLPEIRLRCYRSYGKYALYYNLSKLSRKRIIVIKFPAWIYCLEYPLIKINNARVIILFRDSCDIVMSIQNMFKITFPKNKNIKIKELVNYWCRVYENILDNKELMNNNKVVFLKYEDLLKDPKKITKRLFAFISSKQRWGVDSYKQPDNYKWEWKFDDAGDRIKSLRVQEKTKYDENQRREVLKIINSSAKTASLMIRLNNHEKRINVK